MFSLKFFLKAANNKFIKLGAVVICTLAISTYFTGHIPFTDATYSSNSSSQQPTSSPNPTFPPIDESAIYVIDSGSHLYKRAFDQSSIIAFQENIGVIKKWPISKNEEVLVSTQENQTFVGSTSPDGQILVYNLGTREEETFTESDIYVYDLTSNQVTKEIPLPTNKTFVGVSYWSQINPGFYYTFRSNSANLHFPDPETTEYYWFDLNSYQSTFLASGSDFGQGHTDIIGETPDGNAYYVSEVGHGEYTLEQLIQVDKKSGAKKVFFNQAISQGASYSIQQRNFENNQVVLSETIHETEFDSPINHITINFDTNTITRNYYISTRPEHISTALDSYLVTTSQNSHSILIKDKQTQELIHQIPIESEDTIKISSPTDDGYISFWHQENKDRMGLIDPKTGNYYYVAPPIGHSQDVRILSLLDFSDSNPETEIITSTLLVKDTKPLHDIYVDIHNDGVFLHNRHWFTFSYPKEIFTSQSSIVKNYDKEEVGWYSDQNISMELHLGLFTHDADWFWYSDGAIKQVSTAAVLEKLFPRNYAHKLRDIETSEYKGSVFRLDPTFYTREHLEDGFQIIDGYAAVFIKDNLYVVIHTNAPSLDKQLDIINQVADSFSPLSIDYFYQTLENNENIYH